MVTTIQVAEQTLDLLKKVKDETNSDSYDSVITELILQKVVKGSMAGYLGKFLGKKSKKEILINLRDKHERF